MFLAVLFNFGAFNIAAPWRLIIQKLGEILIIEFQKVAVLWGIFKFDPIPRYERGFSL